MAELKEGGIDLVITDAKIVPFSSVVGQGIVLMNESGRVIGQLTILNLPPSTDYREGSQAIAMQIVQAIRGF